MSPTVLTPAGTFCSTVHDDCARRRAAGAGRRVAGVGRRAAGAGRRAAGVGRRAAGPENTTGYPEDIPAVERLTQKVLLLWEKFTSVESQGQEISGNQRQQLLLMLEVDEQSQLSEDLEAKRQLSSSLVKFHAHPENSMLEPWRGRWLRGSLPTSSTGGESRECQRDTSEEPAQKLLCTENAFWRDSGPHSVPVRNSSCDPTENVEKTKK
ncbi:uncharacterized protein LOC118145663 isoform X7 [Callithrix jacchus]